MSGHKGQLGLSLPALCIVLGKQHAETYGSLVGHVASPEANLGGLQVIQSTRVASEEQDAGHTNIAGGHEGVGGVSRFFLISRRILKSIPIFLSIGLLVVIARLILTQSGGRRASSKVYGSHPAPEIRVDHVGADEAVLERRHLLEGSAGIGSLVLGKSLGW